MLILKSKTKKMFADLRLLFTFNGNIWNYFLRWQLIKYDHVFFFQHVALIISHLHITLLAVHDGKRRSPVTVHMYPLCKKVQFKDKNKVNKTNITNVTFPFSFPENNFKVSWTKSYILYENEHFYIYRKDIHTHTDTKTATRQAHHLQKSAI